MVHVLSYTAHSSTVSASQRGMLYSLELPGIIFCSTATRLVINLQVRTTLVPGISSCIQLRTFCTISRHAITDGNCKQKNSYTFKSMNKAQ